jgi:hypothetical protein
MGTLHDWCWPMGAAHSLGIASTIHHPLTTAWPWNNRHAPRRVPACLLQAFVGMYSPYDADHEDYVQYVEADGRKELNNSAFIPASASQVCTAPRNCLYVRTCRCAMYFCTIYIRRCICM